MLEAKAPTSMSFARTAGDTGHGVGINEKAARRRLDQGWLSAGQGQQATAASTGAAMTISVVNDSATSFI